MMRLDSFGQRHESPCVRGRRLDRFTVPISSEGSFEKFVGDRNKTFGSAETSFPNVLVAAPGFLPWIPDRSDAPDNGSHRQTDGDDAFEVDRR